MSKRPKEVEDAIEKAEMSTLELIKFIEKERDDHVATMSAEINTLKTKLAESQEQCDGFKSEMIKAQNQVKELEDEMRIQGEKNEMAE
jgi:hypothetical protein